MGKYTIIYKTADGNNTWVCRDNGDAAMQLVNSLATRGCTNIVVFPPNSGNPAVAY